MTVEPSDITGILIFTICTLAISMALTFVPIGDASGGIGVVGVTVSHGGLP